MRTVRTTVTSDHIRIEAPDEGSATALAHALVHLGAEVVGGGGDRVEVAVPARDEHAPELNCVLRTTQRWVAQHELPGARVRVAGRSYYLAAS
jgi:hypothetical protein